MDYLSELGNKNLEAMRILVDRGWVDPGLL